MYETSRLTARARSLFYPRSRGLGKMMRTILKSTQKWERSTLKNGVDFIVYATKMVWTNRKEGSRKPRISQYHFQDFPGKSAWSQLARESGIGKRWGGGWGGESRALYECAKQNNKLVLAMNFGSFIVFSVIEILKLFEQLSKHLVLRAFPLNNLVPRDFPLKSPGDEVGWSWKVNCKGADGL